MFEDDWSDYSSVILSPSIESDCSSECDVFSLSDGPIPDEITRSWLLELAWDDVSAPLVFPHKRAHLPVKEEQDKHEGSVKRTKMTFLPTPQKLCCIEGCSKPAKSGGACSKHGGGSRCKHIGCWKHVVSRGLCVEHGGGKPCKVAHCEKHAQVNGLCSEHGGSKRCTAEGCTKTAITKGKCFSHGGGRCCSVEGCSRRVRKAGLCWKHGQATTAV